MQTHWMRYVYALLALCVLAAFAVLISMSIPRAGSQSPALAQARQAFDMGDLDGALATANDILSRNPDDIAALLAKASTLAQKGSLEFKEKEYGDQAIAVAERVLALDPNKADAWRIIGYANEIMQNYPAAHAAYANASSMNPKDALTISQEAHAYDLQGDMEKAEAGYRRALELEPSLAQANLGLARVLVYQDRAQEALPLLEYVASNPGNARQRAGAAYSAGQIHEAAGNYTSAETLFRSSTTLDPQYALGWTGLATELSRQAIDKTSNLAMNARGVLINQSIGDLTKAITIDPNQSLAHYQLAIEMVAMGQPANALIILKGLQEQTIGVDITLSSNDKTTMQQKVQAAITAISAAKTK